MRKILPVLCLSLVALLSHAQVDRYPAIQSPNENSAIIAWNTATAGVGSVVWGTSAGLLTNTLTEPSSTKTHAITISGLQPNTQYWYKATSGSFASSVEYFYTAKPDSVRKLDFIVYGDCGFANSQQATMANLMARETVDFALVVGDVDQNVGNDYDTRFYQQYKDQLKHTCHFTAIGNHDVITNNTNYVNAFILPHNNPANSEQYYSFTWGNAKFITINGNDDYTAGSAQYVWLENELKCNNSEWTFVYFHQPPWSNCWDASYYIPFTPFFLYQGNTDMRTSIVPLFERYKVDFVLNGHTHNYESGVYNGVHYLITGGGGAATNDSHTNSNSPNIQFEANVDNYMKFTINGDTAKYYTTDINGNIIDTLKLTKTFTPYRTTITPTNAKCFGAKDGAVSLQVQGPKPAYTYAWSNGITTANQPQLTAGTYTVTISDANSCKKTETVTITQPAKINTTSVVTAPLCNGNSNGAIRVATNGGTGAYQYQWSSGQTTANLTGITSGQYTLITTDANLCKDTLNATVTQPTSLTSTIAITNPLCFGDANNSINLAATGGTGAYTYQWSNGASTSQLNAVAVGTYFATITDANGCFNLDTATLIMPPQILASALATDVLCNGGASGNVTLNLTGGTSPFTYKWNTGATSANLNNVTASQYSLTLTDANGCLDTITTTVNQPAAITASIDTIGLTCYGDRSGSANIVATGGSGTYTYNWNTGATTQSLTNLPAGPYGATVTDGNGCIKTLTSIIKQPAQLNATASISQITCYGSANGSINIGVSGGVYPYVYNWTNGETTSNLSNLPPGQYTVYVTDDHGCKDTLSSSITQPTGMAASQLVTPPTCNGGNNGQVFLSVTGGVSPYTYLWDNGATTSSINASAGTYNATITDSRGCSKIVVATIADPVAIQVQDSVKDTYCTNSANGKIILTASGGIAPYTYRWDNGVNPNTLPAGTYNVTVTDARNCSVTKSYSVLAQGGNVAPVLTYVGTNFCSNDSLAIIASNGYTNYQWNNGATTGTIYAHTAGSYYATATDSYGCTVYSDSVTIKVDAIPHLQISGAINLLSVHLEASQTDANSYTWHLGDGQTVTDSTGVLDYTYTDSGTYVIQLVSNFACGNDTARYEVQVADTATGIIYLSGKVVNVSLEPNPFSEVTTLIFDQATGQTFKLMLYTVDGKLVRDMGINVGTTVTIRRGGLAAGVYLLNITGDKFNKTMKLIVE